VDHLLRKVVIPTAGLGTRFLPVTRAIPKEMLPIVDTPAIQLIVEEALRAGALDVILVNGRNKGAIEDHFDRAYELEDYLSRRGRTQQLQQMRALGDLARISSVRQKEVLGLGHAVLSARHAVGDEWFGVLLADDIIDGDEPAIGQLVKVARETGKAAVALLPVPDDRTHLYGVAAGPFLQGTAGAAGHILVDQIVEKPAPGTAPSNLAVIGRYVLPPGIFQILSEQRPGQGGEIQLTDALAVLAARGQLVGVRFTGVRHDAGDRLGYLQANIAYALKRPELREPLLDWMRELVCAREAAK
jgi:UTP--glucose-1-phosphate uridylyltransferase